jgi:hydrogenase maturation protease
MTPALADLNVKPGEKVLVYGIGNLGRQDDGLGIRLVEQLKETVDVENLPRVITFECNYQLSIEDALLVSDYDVVFFVDASREVQTSAPFTVRQLGAGAELAFTTHAMSFQSVLSLCEELYERRPRTFLIAVHGYEWDIAENLSHKAIQNLSSAFESMKRLLSGVTCMNSH